jgi:hypothetical protein
MGAYGGAVHRDAMGGQGPACQCVLGREPGGRERRAHGPVHGPARVTVGARGYGTGVGLGLGDRRHGGKREPDQEDEAAGAAPVNGVTVSGHAEKDSMSA